MESEVIFKNDSIQLDVRSDGIYLSLSKPPGKKPPGFEEIISILRLNGIQEFDNMEVAMALSECASREKASKKIAAQSARKVIEDSFTVEITKDKMAASILIKPGINQTKKISKQDVIKALTDMSVVYGIQEDLIDKALQNMSYFTKYVVATGTAPIPGKNGYLEFYFDVSEKKPIPEVNEDGTVDFRKLNLFEIVEKHDLLVTLYPPEEGAEGTNVLGTTLPFTKGKLVNMPRGRNTYTSEDGLSLYAATNGHVTYRNKVIEVQPVLNIPGDVDHTTGNIWFIGSLIIQGNVRTGFSVESEDDIEIIGTVEGAKIRCGGNLTINGGIQGMNKADINVTGNISCKFVEHASIIAGGNISSGAVMHSHVTCKGFLQIGGQSGGLLVGGRTTVQDRIFAKTIGAPLGTVTHIEVGLMPETIQKYDTLVSAKTTMETELKKLNQAFKYLSNAQETTNSPMVDRKKMYYKVVNSIVKIKEELANIAEELEKILPEMKTQNGYIVASEEVYPGVKTSIGNAALHVREPLGPCKLYNKDGQAAIEQGAAFLAALREQLE